MKNGKHRGLWVAALCLALVYPFLFPHPLGRGLYLKPVWALDLAAAERDNARRAVAEPYTWFRAGERFGYVTLEGDLCYLDRVLFGVSLSDSGFINYPKVHDNLVFADPNGRFQYGLSGAGYPLLDREGKRLFTVSTDLTALRHLGVDGETLWKSEFSSPMTTVAVSEDRVLVGLLEGKARLIGPNGASVFEYSPSGSRIPVILGSALSPGGEQMAVAAGIDPQRLVVLEAREGRFSPSLEVELDSDFRREMRLRFTEDGRYLLFERSGAIGVLDLTQKREYRVPHEGRLQDRIDASVSDIVVFLSALSDSPDGEQAQLYALQLPQRLFSRIPMRVRPDFLRRREAHLFLGLEGTLVRIDVREES